MKTVLDTSDRPAHDALVEKKSEFIADVCHVDAGRAALRLERFAGSRGVAPPAASPPKSEYVSKSSFIGYPSSFCSLQSTVRVMISRF